MHSYDYGLLLAFFALVLLPAPWLGRFYYKVMEGQRTWLTPVLGPVEKVCYRVAGVDPGDEHTWQKYALALLAFNLAGFVLLFASLLLQQYLPLNPQQLPGQEWTQAFNTAVSFVTNTNWQSYSGEATLSYFSQMAGLTVQNFVSAATGLAVLVALCRGISRRSARTLGNFWVDMTRATLYGLLPLCLVLALLLVWQGVPQTFAHYVNAVTMQGTDQVIPLGPAASQIAIKQLGTNGGGFLGANSTTPLENPTIISDMIELYSMMLFPGACVITFGKMVRGRKKKDAAGDKALAGSESAGQLSAGGAEQGPRLKDHSLTASIYGWEGRTIFLAMGIIFLVGLGVCYWSELQGNPALAKIGLDQSMGSMEGKEVRFGIAQSAMFTTTTTSFTTGTVNNMHDTLTPLGGMIPLLHMMLNVVFGGKGVGLMNMIMYAILAVFICGLMIGRTPEYLGKKIEGREMKLTALCIIIHPFLILFFSALAVSTSGGLEGITNPGFHGLSQVLYEYASSAANNGSGFEGLADNSYFWNITAGLAMFFGRYLSIVIQLAIAGSLMRKRFVNETVGTLRTDTLSFAVILVFVVYIFAALTFFPALALGPIAEHLTLWA